MNEFDYAGTENWCGCRLKNGPSWKRRNVSISGKVVDGYIPPFRLSVLLRTKFPVPRSFVRMRFPCGGKICGED